MEILPKLIRNQLFFITFCSLAPRSGENFDVRVFWMRFPFDFDHYLIFCEIPKVDERLGYQKSLKKPLKKQRLRGEKL